MTTLDEFMEAKALVESCRATVACGCQIDDQDEWASDALYFACKEYIEAYVERYPVWRGLP